MGNLSIFMIGLGFAVRANIAPNLQAEIYDKIDLANSASPEGMDEVMHYASVESFQSVAIWPLLLLPVFGLIWMADHRSGGHQPKVIGEPATSVKS